MSQEPNQINLAGLGASVAEGLDAVLAMLLLAKRVHVENITLVEPTIARVELSGEAIRYGLGALGQVVNLSPPGKAKQTRRDEDEEDGEGDSGEGGVGSVWQALKDFALPPTRRRSRK